MSDLELAEIRARLEGTLRPCNFCETPGCAVSVGPGVWRVRCHNEACGAEGPEGKTPDDAILGWNVLGPDVRRLLDALTWTRTCLHESATEAQQLREHVEALQVERNADAEEIQRLTIELNRVQSERDVAFGALLSTFGRPV